MNGLLQVNKQMVRVTLRIGTEKIDLMVSQGNVSSYLAAEKRLFGQPEGLRYVNYRILCTSGIIFFEKLADL